MADETVSFPTRLRLALLCLFQILFDGAFAARVLAVREGRALPEGRERPSSEPPPSRERPSSEPPPSSERPSSVPPPSEPARAPEEAALVLLGLLQREGRLIDFLEQEIESFDDAEIGAAARVLHAGCRKALHRHAEVEPVRSEEEDSRVEIAEGIDSGEVKLVGSVGGEPPYRGVLKHRGWRVTLSLPEPIEGHQVAVVAPAEVEL